jgi:hypothetical protein
MIVFKVEKGIFFFKEAYSAELIKIYISFDI